jgi:hypothetical protein
VLRRRGVLAASPAFGKLLDYGTDPFAFSYDPAAFSV